MSLGPERSDSFDMLRCRVAPARTVAGELITRELPSPQITVPEDTVELFAWITVMSVILILFKSCYLAFG